MSPNTHQIQPLPAGAANANKVRTVHFAHQPQARRSGRKEGRRSASAAPTVIHLVPCILLLFLIIAAVRASRILLRPMTQELAASGQSNLPNVNPTPMPEVFPLAAFTPEVRRWQSQIETWSLQFNLPANLIATVIQIESCGDPMAKSGAGALGLFQVMPFHFEAEQDPLEIETNAQAGLQYLARSYDLAGGDNARTLAGYNGGHGVIELAAAEWPAETQRYATWGSGILQDITQDDIPSPTLARWLEAGGQHLCQQAATVQSSVRFTQ